MTTLNPLARFHQRIAETAGNTDAPPVVIVAFGDSVTAGENPVDVYHAQLLKLLEARYPDSRFEVINSGVGGETATGGLARVDKDVIAFQPDLTLIAFGLNDCAEGDLDGLPKFTENIESLVNQTREATTSDIMLLSTNWMPTHATDAIPPEWAHVTDMFLHLQNDGILAAYARRLGEIAQAEGIAFGDVYGGWKELSDSGVDTTAMLVNGLNHPDAEGGRLAASVIMKTIEAAA